MWGQGKKRHVHFDTANILYYLFIVYLMVRLLGRINTFLKGSSTWGFLQYSSMHNLIILKKKERINSLLNELNWREVYSTKKVW